MKKKDAMKKIHRIKDEIGALLDREEVEVGMALSLLLSIFVATARHQAEMPPHEIIKIVAQAVCISVEQDDEEDDDEDDEVEDAIKQKGDLQWLN